ncbi:polysaccharide biosynthesis protein [Microlunatus kandeliicorticis]|nr:nucleoside-diphosphate sugar epimerase/dehydratase [Microlunatus kandeliicorticis]
MTSEEGDGGRALRPAVLRVVDTLAVAVGMVLAHAARYDDSAEPMNIVGLVIGVVVAAAVFLAVATALRLHQGRHALGSADEFRTLAVAVGSATLAVLALDFVTGSARLMPLSVPVVGGLIAFVVTIGYRAIVAARVLAAAPPRAGRRTLVFGAGAAAQQLIRSMIWDDSGHLPVGLLDDDPAKRHLEIKGVRMLGGREDIAAAAARTEAEVLIIALPSAESDLVRDVSERAVAAGLTVKILPKISDLLDRKGIGIRDVRDINIADLLGRRQVETDVKQISGYLRGKRVLVTGAGGSIGSELTRQIHSEGPAELMMLDRDESALHALQLTLFGEARLDLPQAILADIRDGEALRRLFEERRPEVVFHAAALKHLNMLEQYPDEAWKTNVLGTLNVLAAATAVGVDHFINVSTDKAADPVNVLGRSKRLAERLTATFGQHATGRFLSVRFGNVLGSRGSVLETFAAQIARGGPVTVTDPEVTRYFMTIPEAVQLVIQAGAIGADGEALVLDMGTPVRIADVAEQLIKLEGRPIEIRYTGLRPGEKLHEELFGAGEHDERRAHPLISHCAVPAFSLDAVEQIRTAHGMDDFVATEDAKPLPLERAAQLNGVTR